MDRLITLGSPIFPPESHREHNMLLRQLGELRSRRPLPDVDDWQAFDPSRYRSLTRWPILRTALRPSTHALA